MYEIITTACSAIEAEVWRTALTQAIAAQTSAVASGKSNIVPLQSPLALEMRSIGAAFGKPSSFVRRMSVHRSQTVGPTTDLNQVIIKNTQAVKDALSSFTSQVLPRSQSVATPSHVQTLAPRRSDRASLETLLADVWSPALPFPGMTMRRSEQLRGSANHVIRKLSMASITSTFYSSKRSGSHPSMTKLHRDECGKPPGHASRTEARENARPARLPLSELLPADFDLQGQPSKQKRRNALRALTLTMERPFSPLLSSADASKHLSTQEKPVSEITAAHLDHKHFEPITHAPLTGYPAESGSETHDTSRPHMLPPDLQGLSVPIEVAPSRVKHKSRLRKLFG